MGAAGRRVVRCKPRTRVGPRMSTPQPRASDTPDDIAVVVVTHCSAETIDDCLTRLCVARA